MGRTSMRAAAVVTLAALFAGTATASFAATPEEVNTPIPIDLSAGRYIVILDEAPAATYDGGLTGLAPTQPDQGDKLDASTNDVQRYSQFLENRQEDVAQEAGVTPDANLTITLNAFTANLSAAQASKLAATKGVQAVVPDEILRPTAVSSTDFLGLEGPGGVWEAVGGADAAGAGTVVGVIDTGIAPENPSFAGDPLGTDASTGEPYLDGNVVTYAKADGNTFRSERVTQAEAWDSSMYSTKLIGAKYFSDGAAANGFDFGPDYLSPRDADGHGSHTAGTAAGNAQIPASVEGVDFGAVSGVAPGAKVAAYKACYVGPDPLVTSDDICALSDLMAAINAAAADGVDVINYSIGGGAATTTLATEDRAFLAAAAAGIFVSVSAGNDGPGAATADHASPWYTTVAASTIPTYEGTVTAPNGFIAAGASVSVPFGQTVTGEPVYAGDVPAAGAASADAALCQLGTLDPALVAGRIVVCDRGVNARVEKSQAVKDAGGIGMVLVNVTPGSLDNDFHAVPTVHLQSDARDALLAYVRGTDAGKTLTLHGSNITGVETPTPVIAGFSSRGPMLADGSDILKPDLTAPGVAILAATQNGVGEDPTFGFKSGTSMSSPHIAGLAALYLGERPNATPGEIKSAMMTTAYDTVNDDGSTSTDPFAQGAGHVDPTRFFEAGLIYDNGPQEWLQFLQGKNLIDSGVEPIDGSDLNLASIAIGSLSGAQTVTRSVRATTAGTYTASIDVPGVTTTVEPASLTLAEGEVGTFRVTFQRATADVETWATGFLTWTGPTTVRSPVAVFPVTADAPAEVAGEGATGSVGVEVTPGFTGDLPLTLAGLTPRTLQTEALDQTTPLVPGHTGDEGTGDDGLSYYLVDVPEGAKLARFELDSSDDTASDLDLNVYRVVAPDDLRYYEQFTSASGSADESVSLDDPTPGTYLVEVDVFSFTDPFTWDLWTTVVGADGEGSLTATPNPLPGTEGTPTSYTLSWSGLTPDTTYLGVVQYGDSAVRTVVTVDAGPAGPVNVTAPKITGTPKIGKTLKASPGTWDPQDVTTAYQWLRDGAPIDGATAQTYTVAAADAGATLSVQVTATAAGTVNAGVAESAGVVVKFTSRTTVTPNRYLGTSSQNYSVTVAVTPSGGDPATGPVTVWVNARTYSGTLVDGTATIDLGSQKRGIYVVTASYPGADRVEASVGLSGFIVYR